MIFFLAYFVSWLFFALIWWLIMFTHGDLEDEHLPQFQAENNWTPCVLNIHNFTSCYLFSIETQYTIGYGVRTTTEECPQAIFIMSMQAILGMTIDAFFIGIVFAKMTRPMFRTQTLLFSKNALVSRQDGDFFLMFRVGDMRKSPLIGASIRAQMIKAKRTKEGEVLKNYVTELPLAADGGDGSVFLLWPMTVVHKIDEESPLYHFSATDLLQTKLEIMVVLEATVESTGQSVQARTSYLSNEILWGYKFEPIVDHLKRDQGYDVNYKKFNNVYPVETPVCSAAELAGFDRAQQVPREFLSKFVSLGMFWFVETMKPESLSNSFDDDEEEEEEVRPPPPPPPPAAPRTRSLPRSGRPYRGYEENPLMEFTSSYV